MDWKLASALHLVRDLISHPNMAPGGGQGTRASSGLASSHHEATRATMGTSARGRRLILATSKGPIPEFRRSYAKHSPPKKPRC